MAPIAVARQPHHLPVLAIDRQRLAAGEAALGVEADRARRQRRRPWSRGRTIPWRRVWGRWDWPAAAAASDRRCPCPAPMPATMPARPRAVRRAGLTGRESVGGPSWRTIAQTRPRRSAGGRWASKPAPRPAADIHRPLTMLVFGAEKSACPWFGQSEWFQPPIQPEMDVRLPMQFRWCHPQVVIRQAYERSGRQFGGMCVPATRVHGGVTQFIQRLRETTRIADVSEACNAASPAEEKETIATEPSRPCRQAAFAAAVRAADG